MRLQDSVFFPGDPVTFPNSFILLQQGSNKEKQGSCPVAIGSFDEQKVADAMCQKIRELIMDPKEISPREYLELKESHFKLIRIETEARQYCLALQVKPQGFTIFDPPIESGSKEQGSQAIYYAAHEEWGLLVQYIFPHSQTSSHNHEESGWTETNHPLNGRAKLHTCKDQHQLTYPLTMAIPISPVIPPKTIHQIYTEEHSLLNVIEITGDEHWLERWLRKEGHTFKMFPQPQRT